MIHSLVCLLGVGDSSVLHGGTSVDVLIVWTRAVRRERGLILVRASTSIVSSLHFFQTLWHVMFRSHGRKQIDDEREDVEGEDEGNDPFEDGGDVAVRGEGGRHEDNGKCDLDQDEGQFDPEGDAQDAVVTVVDTQALVFCADKDG